MIKEPAPVVTAGLPRGAWGFPKVQGKCPRGCGETLFLASGGYVTCSYIPCPDPCAASDLLDGSTRQTPREDLS